MQRSAGSQLDCFFQRFGPRPLMRIVMFLEGSDDIQQLGSWAAVAPDPPASEADS
jgi:hypothetical protein